MSKSERAMLNISFFGVIFVIAIVQPIGVSHLSWFDKVCATVAAAMIVGNGIRYLYLILNEN